MNSEFRTLVLDPEAVDPDEAATLAVRWLAAQPGQGLILLPAKKAIGNNPFLHAGARGQVVESPSTLAR